MYQLLTKHGSVFALALGAIVSIGALLMIFSGLDGFNALTKETKATTDIFNFGIYGAVFLIGLAALAAVGFGIFQLATNPKGSIKVLAGIAVLALVFFIGYMLSTEDAGPKTALAIQEYKDGIKGGISEGSSKLVSAGIWTTLLLIGGGVLILVASEVRNIFK